MDTTAKTCGLFEAAGFVDVDSEVRDYSYQMTLEDFVGLRQTVGSSKHRFDSLDADARDRLIATVRERLSELAPDDFSFRMQIINTFGTKP